MDSRGHIFRRSVLWIAGAVVVAAACVVLWRVEMRSTPVNRANIDSATKDHCAYVSERIDHRLEGGSVRCQVRVPIHAAGSSDEVEIVLTNEGDETLRFWYTTFGLKEHITLLLRDQSGKMAACLVWKELSSRLISIDPKTGKPTADLPVQTLKPGAAECYLVYPRSVVSSSHGARVPAGRYYFEAIFEYSDCGSFPEPSLNLFARSNRIPVEVSNEAVLVARE